MTPLTLPTLLDSSTRAPDQTESAALVGNDFNNFLTLLTTQLENQDPLQPIDSTEFVAQLAAFSSVEQQVRSNELLEGIADGLGAEAIASYASWIGQAASDAAGRFIASDSALSVAVPREDGATSAEAILRDATGAVLARVPVAQGTTASIPADVLGPLAGQQVSLSFEHRNGERIVADRAASVPMRVTAVEGGAGGPSLIREDGLVLQPADIASVTDSRLAAATP
ncbi:MAG: flagellar hook capping FlgD N-terminal domain-containing protein [Pseudomonadota bacterium]